MYPPVEKPTQSYPPPSTFPNPPPPGPQALGIPATSPQPVAVQPPPTQQPGHWSTGLCDCFSDISSCCLVCWCPCIAFGRLSEIVDKGTSSCCCNGTLYLCLCSLGAVATMFGLPLNCQWIYSCTYRGKIKQDLGMPPSCCEECCTHFWCEPCALCQEYRQLQSQGYDMSLGWNGNMERRGNAMPAMVAAPAAPSMAR